MSASQAISWLEGHNPNEELAVIARFSEVDGWEITGWAVVAGEEDRLPALEVEVFGGDFDYPDPSRLADGGVAPSEGDARAGAGPRQV